MENEIIKYRLHLDIGKQGYSQPNGSFSGQNGGDYYVNIPLYLNNNKYDEYINIDKDKTTTLIDRNNFNPYFIELGFFSSIKTTNSSGKTSVNIYTPNEIIYEKSKLFNLTINR